MTSETLAAIKLELVRARTKFPGTTHIMNALTEETGEVAKALLDQMYGKGDNDAVRKEAIQAAAMAIRLLEEGDPTFPLYQGTGK